MTDEQLNERLDAISEKLDKVLSRQGEAEAREHDILARLARLEKTQS